MGTTATGLDAWLRAHERDRIADFLQARLEERYFAPILALDKAAKNGFLIMAVSCLSIEALQSFREGWKSTERCSERAFKRFLTREPQFAAFSPYAVSFYRGVRCGILHQGETYGGWKIRRSGPLFEKEALAVNATRFHKELNRSLTVYVEELKRSDFKSKLWKHARRKLSELVANCEKKDVTNDE
jgi:hypothetical protein